MFVGNVFRQGAAVVVAGIHGGRPHPEGEVVIRVAEEVEAVGNDVVGRYLVDVRQGVVGRVVDDNVVAEDEVPAFCLMQHIGGRQGVLLFFDVLFVGPDVDDVLCNAGFILQVDVNAVAAVFACVHSDGFGAGKVVLDIVDEEGVIVCEDVVEGVTTGSHIGGKYAVVDDDVVAEEEAVASMLEDDGGGIVVIAVTAAAFSATAFSTATDIIVIDRHLECAYFDGGAKDACHSVDVGAESVAGIAPCIYCRRTVVGLEVVVGVAKE